MTTTSYVSNSPTLTHLPQELPANKIFCDYCLGFCCYRLPGSTLLLTAEDINRIARHFQISDGEVRRRYIEGRNTFKVQGDGACIFLATEKLCKKCTIHAARPRQCQEFPYDQLCPYLHRQDLLARIHPLIAKGLGI